jgi:hypothetical protein
MLDIPCSSKYQIRAQGNQVKSHFNQSARDNIAELHDLHRYESDAEHLEFIDFLLADSMCLFPVAECMEGGVHGSNQMHRELKAANEWLAFTGHPGESQPMANRHQILSSGE